MRTRRGNRLAAGAVLAAASVIALGASSAASGAPAHSNHAAASTKHAAPSGTVTFAEEPGSTPTDIFPMTPVGACTYANTGQFSWLMFKPLYHLGDNDTPTITFPESMAPAPVASNHDKTYTIHLTKNKWSDGEPVTADDLVFWMNMYKANPAANYCLHAPGYIPENVKSYKAVNERTFQLTFKHSYNPTWVLYNELYSLTPAPLAWDRTSLSQPVPKKFAGSIGSTVKGAEKVYKFLDAQGTTSSSWATSPLWQVVDGPFKLAASTSTGQETLVPNPAYTGSPKASIAKLVELPFTSDTAIVNQVKSGGPDALTIASLPPQDAPQLSSIESQGYTLNKDAAWGDNFIDLNLNNPTVGPMFRQLYVRQALEHLVDQPGWIHAILNGAGVPDYGFIPTKPVDPVAPLAGGGANPYPFSVSAAQKLLAANGWKVAAGGTSTCVKPGTGKGECGAGIAQGEKAAFTLNYESGSVTATSMMQDWASQARKIGINITLETHTLNSVFASAVPCTPKQAVCANAQATYWGGYNYAVSYPSGESFFLPGSAGDLENFNSPELTKLVRENLSAPPSQAKAAMTRFANYIEKNLPQIYLPLQIGTLYPSAGVLVSNKLEGYTGNADGQIDPENWRLQP